MRTHYVFPNYSFRRTQTKTKNSQRQRNKTASHVFSGITEMALVFCLVFEQSVWNQWALECRDVLQAEVASAVKNRIKMSWTDERTKSLSGSISASTAICSIKDQSSNLLDLVKHWQSPPGILSVNLEEESIFRFIVITNLIRYILLFKVITA